MNSKDLIRIASYFDIIGDYQKADRYVKLAIDKKDFDYSDIYKNPETKSDFTIKQHLTEEPIEGDTFDYLRSKTFQPKTPITNTHELVNNLYEMNKDLTHFSDVYPNIYFYFEDGVAKFLHIDPTSLDSLREQSDPSGEMSERIDEEGNVFRPDNLGLDYLPIDDEDEVYLDPAEVKYTTDLPEDLGRKRIFEILRRNFPAAHIQFIEDFYDDDSHMKEIEISLLDS